MVGKTEYVDVQGKIKFIHAVNFNKYEKWSITFYPTTESRNIIHDLQAEGVKNVMKKDDDNAYYIQFSREPTKLIRGKVVAWPAPRVVDKDGQLMDGSTIGWGTDATIRLEIYQHGTPNGGKSKAARWDSIRVDNLVPWSKDELPPAEAEHVESLTNSPKPVW